jgi:hypothetical protein
VLLCAGKAREVLSAEFPVLSAGKARGRTGDPDAQRGTFPPMKTDGGRGSHQRSAIGLRLALEQRGTEAGVE